jgi:hypothetical protein
MSPCKKHTHAMTRPEHGIPDFISLMRARNPVFWPKWGIKNRGFRALDTTMRCSRLKALFFCHIFEIERWVLQKHTHAMTRRCVALLIEGFVILSHICKMGLTKTHARDDTTMRCSLESRLNALFFCLARWVLQKHTHEMTRRCVALSIEGFVLL